MPEVIDPASLKPKEAPVCKQDGHDLPRHNDGSLVKCRRCGRWRVCRLHLGSLPCWTRKVKWNERGLKHAIREAEAANSEEGSE